MWTDWVWISVLLGVGAVIVWFKLKDDDRRGGVG